MDPSGHFSLSNAWNWVTDKATDFYNWLFDVPGNPTLDIEESKTTSMFLTGSGQVPIVNNATVNSDDSTKRVNIDLDGSISDFSSLTERDISKLIGEMALDIWDKDMYEAYLKFHGNDISDKGVSAEW